MLVNDIKKMTEQVNTTMLEIFHGVKIRYLPKSIFYKMEKLFAGTQLAALDHNNNVNRSQVKTRPNKHTIRGSELAGRGVEATMSKRRHVDLTLCDDRDCIAFHKGNLR